MSFNEIISLCTYIRNGDLNKVKECFANSSKESIDAEWKCQYFDFTSPIHEAAEHGHTHMLKYLLSDSIGFDVNELTSHGSHIVHLAAYYGKVSTLEFILNEYNVYPEIETSETKCSPLHLAARNGHLNVAKSLLESYHVNIHKGDASGSTALHKASGWSQLEIIEYLVCSQGANMEIQRNDDGFTCLMVAVYYNKRDSVELLLDLGANIEALSFEGCTAAHIAMERRNYECLYSLICRGADIDVVCKECTVRNMEQFSCFELRQCVKYGLKDFETVHNAVLTELNKELKHLFCEGIVAEVMNFTYPKTQNNQNEKKRHLNDAISYLPPSKRQKL